MAGLLLSGAARADYMWFDDRANTLKVQVGQFDQPRTTVADFKSVKAVSADGKPLAVESHDSSFTVRNVKSGDVRLTSTQDAGNGVLVYHQARYGCNDTKAVNDFELVPTTPNGNTFQLMWKGKPVAAAQVNVATSQGWRRVMSSAEDGTIPFDTPFTGLYVLEVTARVNNGSVTVDGKQYNDVRQTATLSFEVAK